MIQKFEMPFTHYKIDNFLDDKDFNSISNIYDGLQFYEKHTDLFKFLQTNELKTDSSLDFFKNNLLDLAKNIDLPNIDDIDLFASFYRKGDYLLCHDDLIGNRQYAFSYYLEDFQSGGELIFFNSNADKEMVRLNVEKNTLVVFQVSSISFHEVNICESEGRKAFTGWFNYEKERDILPHKNFVYERLFIKIDSDLVPLSVDINKEINLINDIQINLETQKDKVRGPFYSRKLFVNESSPLLFIISGLDLYYKHTYGFIDGCYLLLNDSVNEIEGDVYDLFYFIKNRGMVIKYVSKDGDVVFDLKGIASHCYLIRRNGRKMFFERTDGFSHFKHFIYLRP